jgi:hypothetical protein
VIEIAGSRAEPIADITHRLAFCKLTKQHRYQMSPAIKTFVVLIGLLFLDQCRKLSAIQLRNNLGE